jgi:hypothetical protein
MVTLQNTTSIDGQHALQDMVELQMYLVAQTQEKPWLMLPRGLKTPFGAKEPYSNVVESRAAKELFGLGLIEAVSSQTFIVSKSGYQFYEREMRPLLSLIHKGRK